MLNKQPEQDFHPIQPDEPKLTENEVEAEMETELTAEFFSGRARPMLGLTDYITKNVEEVARLMLAYTDNGEDAGICDLVDRFCAEFVEMAKNHPGYDYLRREIEAGR